MVGARQRVYLHIGVPKTGTTYLQEVLWSNRQALRETGVLYPGSRPDAHFLAMQDLRELLYHGHRDEAVDGAWQRLVDEVRAWPGTSVISHEMLAPAEPDAVRRAMESFAGLEVHVVCTARDLARQVPAVWQEDMKNRGVLTFAEFTRSLQGLDDSVDPFFADVFWTYQDLPAVLRTWATGIPPERVHLVTVPQGGTRDALWHRFAGAVGIDPARCPAEVDIRNPSMGVVETNLLRRLNWIGARDLDWPSYEGLVKTFLAVDVLAAREESVPLRLPVEDRDWVERRSKETVAALLESGYHVVGHLDELQPAWQTMRSTDQPSPRHPDDADDAQILDAALHALVETLRLVVTDRQRFEDERRQFDEERRRFEKADPKRAILEKYKHDSWMRWLLDRYRGTRTWLNNRSSR